MDPDEFDPSLFQESPLEPLKPTVVTDPVLKLPPEVTCHIFLHCIPPSGGGIGRAKTAPLLLLTVCRAWRAIALSFPALWATLELDATTIRAMNDPDKMEQFTTTWFSRSGTLPLIFRFYGYLREPPGAVHLHSVLRRLAPRLQALDLRLDHDCMHTLTHIGPAFAFPVLEALTIAAVKNSISAHYTGAPPEMFSDAPQLRELDMKNMSPSRITLPYAQLTRLTVRRIRYREAFDVLRAASALREFVVDNLNLIGSHYTNEEQPLSHPALTSLSLNSAAHIVQYLSLPALHSLRISNSYTLMSDSDVFIAFLARSSKTLSTFSFDTSTTEMPGAWFTSLVNLTSLEIRLHSGRWLRPKSDIFRAMNRALAPDVLPSLERLLISECVAFDSLDANMLDAVASRCSGGDVSVGLAVMRSFRMICDRVRPVEPIASPLITGLDDLAARGMEIHLGTEDKVYNYRYGYWETQE
ncbi:hypothetical protein C8J57DRAFT_1309465 [Mycena rebaudengoi]|nr:hypothetical protein C8J57DRAFT_1309465 [Mycena rebaudengoi]